MTSGKEKFGRIVRFAPTEADQALLRAVEKVLEQQLYTSFSDLCKQALQQFLFPPENPQTAVSFTLVQQQIIELQMQVARLESESKVWQAYPFGLVEQRLMELGDRLARLEQQPPPAISQNHSPPPAQPDASPLKPAEVAEAAEAEAVDPLLSRLAPWLEDF